MNNLDPAQILALSRFVNTKSIAKAKKEIQHGTPQVISPFTVNCDGGILTLNSGEDYTPTVDLPLLDVLVIALHKAGFQRENIMEVITSAASDALKNGNKVGSETKGTISFVKKEVEALKVSLSAGLPKKTRAGKLKLKAKWS